MDGICGRFRMCQGGNRKTARCVKSNIHVLISKKILLSLCPAGFIIDSTDIYMKLKQRMLGWIFPAQSQIVNRCSSDQYSNFWHWKKIRMQTSLNSMFSNASKFRCNLKLQNSSYGQYKKCIAGWNESKAQAEQNNAAMCNHHIAYSE